MQHASGVRILLLSLPGAALRWPRATFRHAFGVKRTRSCTDMGFILPRADFRGRTRARTKQHPSGVRILLLSLPGAALRLPRATIRHASGVKSKRTNIKCFPSACPGLPYVTPPA